MNASKRILVVDDSRSARAYIMDAITKEGYEAYEAGSGIDALKFMDQISFDAIVLDLLMPEMDGFMLLEHMRSKGIEIPVVVLSADIQEEVKQEVLELGARAMLNKPMDKKVLLDTLKRISS